MTVETEIFDTLKSLVANRVYPMIGPVGVAKPYITYQQVGGESVNYMEQSIPDKRNSRFQINVWHTDMKACAALTIQVENALRTNTDLRTAVIGAPTFEYEEDTKLIGSRQDFSFWC